MSTLAATTAAAFDSNYTSIAANRCKKTVNLRIGKIEYAVSRICAGSAGYKVYVDEEDLRDTLTIGKSGKQALKEPAAHDHYHGFNGYEDTIEITASTVTRTRSSGVVPRVRRLPSSSAGLLPTTNTSTPRTGRRERDCSR